MPFDLAAIVLVTLKLCTLVALLGGAWTLWTVAARMGWYERCGLVLLFAASLTLREAAPASPHDTYMRSEGALWNDWPGFDRGMGFVAFGQLVRPWLAEWRADELWLFERVAVVGALLPVLVVAWLWVLEAAPRVVWAAGALMALSSPHVRLSHTDAQQIPALTLVWIGLCAWALHARSPRWLPALVAGCALAAAGSARLECVALPVVFAVVAWADRGFAGWRHPAGVAASALCLGVVSVHTYGLVFVGAWKPLEYAGQSGEDWTTHSVLTYGLKQLVILDPAYTAPWIALLTVAGLFGVGLDRRLRWALGAVAVALCLEMPVWSPAGGEAFALSRYQVAASPFAVILAANGLAALVAMWPARGVALVGLAATLLASATRLPVAYAPSTLSAEYTFIRDTLTTLSPGCTVLYEGWGGDKGLYFPFLIPPLVHMPIQAVDVSQWGGDTAGCVIYYRGASCVMDNQGGPVCSDFPARHALEPLATADLPSRQWVYDVYPGDTVLVGFYRVGASTDAP